MVSCLLSSSDKNLLLIPTIGVSVLKKIWQWYLYQYYAMFLPERNIYCLGQIGKVPIDKILFV